jgi:hypothetical protein
MIMKRYIFVLLILAASFAANANTKINSSIVSIVNEYSSEPGCDVVSVGNLGVGLVKVLGKLSAESKEDKDVLSVFDGINKILVVDYEEMEFSKRQILNSRLAGVLDTAEKIIEVKDEEDTLLVYGTSGKGGETLEDIIIYVPEDYALICFWGSIDFDRLADLIKASNESI